LNAIGHIDQSDVLYYYEDHGNDPQSRVTQYVLREMGLNVYHCRSTGAVEQIRSIEDLHRIKVKKTYGYNFLACKPQSKFLELLPSL
jgi:hypothetical protein